MCRRTYKVMGARGRMNGTLAGRACLSPPTMTDTNPQSYTRRKRDRTKRWHGPMSSLGSFILSRGMPTGTRSSALRRANCKMRSSDWVVGTVHPTSSRTHRSLWTWTPWFVRMHPSRRCWPHLIMWSCSTAPSCPSSRHRSSLTPRPTHIPTAPIPMWTAPCRPTTPNFLSQPAPPFNCTHIYRLRTIGATRWKVRSLPSHQRHRYLHRPLLPHPTSPSSAARRRPPWTVFFLLQSRNAQARLLRNRSWSSNRQPRSHRQGQLPQSSKSVRVAARARTRLPLAHRRPHALSTILILSFPTRLLRRLTRRAGPR
ncbi:hypothetical protein BD413DRAFT_67515 [Trametes elegans]|nr:hypothetical protein BD413DRAFT_67515 [Trametes elegans]